MTRREFLKLLGAGVLLGALGSIFGRGFSLGSRNPLRGLKFRWVGDEMEVSRGSMRARLNRTGGEVVEAVARGGPRRAVRELARKYGISEAEAARDVARFLDELRGLGLAS